MYRLSDPASLVKLTIYLLACTLQPSASAQQPANSKVVLQESFDRSEPGDQWTILTGQWKLADGALTGVAPNGKSPAVICCKAASAQGFANRKSAIVFSCNGGPVEIDDIQIWTQL